MQNGRELALYVAPAKAGCAKHSPSCAGLTRASIHLRKSLSEKMDCRVKPGNDDYVMMQCMIAGIGATATIG
jgi:hypothetical protein